MHLSHSFLPLVPPSLSTGITLRREQFMKLSVIQMSESHYFYFMGSKVSPKYCFHTSSPYVSS
jgi:hypothetical protein